MKTKKQEVGNDCKHDWYSTSVGICCFKCGVKQPITDNSWAGEFDKLWQELFNRDFLLRDWEAGGRDVKQFISQLLQKQREDLIEEASNEKVSKKYR